MHARLHVEPGKGLTVRFGARRNPGRHRFFTRRSSVNRPPCQAAFTVVVANLELGVTHDVFIRGEGAGLRWDQGVRLRRVDQRTWIWSSRGLNTIPRFQLLLDDEIWERGEPRRLEPGLSLQVTPDFEWPDMPRVASHPRSTAGQRKLQPEPSPGFAS